MAKRLSKRHVEYEPVSESAIVDAVRGQCRRPHDVGEQLWPHLSGHGPMHGGPSSCAIAASFRLSRLVSAGKVEKDYINGVAHYRAKRMETE